MNTLKSLLPTSEHLIRIAALWGMMSTQHPDNTALCLELLRRMADPVAARFVWEQLQEAERHVLWQCLGKRARGGCHRETVLVRSGMPAEAFDAVVASLEQALLLVAYSSPEKHGASMLGAYEESAAALYVTGRELFFAGAARTDQELDKLLPDLSMPDLWCLVHRYQLDPTALITQADLRKALVHALANQVVVHTSLAQQPPLVQQVLPWLHRQGGYAPLPSVGEAFELDGEALYRLLHQLEDAGLAFDTLCPGQPGRQIFVPQALRRDLTRRERGIQEAEEGSTLVPLSGPPPVIEEGVPRSAYDLVIALNAVYQGRVEVTRSLQVTEQCAQRLLPHLKGGRPERKGSWTSYLELLFRTAESLQLIRREEAPWPMGVKTQYAPSEGVTAWATRDLVAQTRVLLSEWSRGVLWQDVFYGSFHQWDWSSWEPEAGRALLLSFLRECRANEWYSVEALLLSIWKHDPYALRPELRGAAGKRFTTIVQREKWWRAEGALLRGMLLSTLWEFGIVSLGYEAGEAEGEAARAIAFQITELGTAALREEQPENEASPTWPSPSLIMQGNFEALLFGYEPETLFRLLPWAASIEVQQSCRLTFTEHSIQQAIFHGQQLEQLLQLLKERSRKAVPQAVEYSFKEWARRYREVQIAQGILLTVASSETAGHICCSPEFRGLGLVQVAPLVFIAPAHANIADLRRILEKGHVAVHLTQSVCPKEMAGRAVTVSP